MKTPRKNRQIKKLLRAFGPVSVTKAGENFSAQVPGFAVYGKNHFLLSLGGRTVPQAYRNLFNQICHSAANTDEKQYPDATRAYNGERREVVYDSQTGTFVLTDRVYNDRLGF